MEHDNDVLITICDLVAILVANVVKDINEWKEWGVPFLGIIMDAQFGQLKGRFMLEKFEAKFCPLIGHGISLVLENSEEDNFTIVRNSDDFVNSILQSLDNVNIDFEDVLGKYLENFLSSTFQSESYDSRSRTVARRMCVMLDVSAIKFSELENKHWNTFKTEESSVTQVAIRPNSSAYSASFTPKDIHFQQGSLLASFRLWRVAFIAAGGGAMMAVASRLAAPTILETILPMLCATTTVGQVSLALNAILGCVGLSATVVPYLMGGSYGAAVAGYRMLKRTEPLKEFMLEPLHVPVVSNKLAVTSALDDDPFALVLTASTAEREQRAEQSGEDPVIVKRNLPVFILVSGHVAKGVDSRTIWGANGLTCCSGDECTVESTSVTSTREDIITEVSSLAAEKTFLAAELLVEELHVVADAMFRAASPEHNAETGRTSTEDDDETLGDSLSEWEKISTQLQGNGWWRDIVLNGDEYLLHWDRSVLERLNESFQQMLTDKFQKMLYDEVLSFTPVAAITGAAHLPMMVLGKLKEIDDPWVVAMDRARQAGMLLARILLAEHSNHDTSTEERDVVESVVSASSIGGHLAVSSYDPSSANTSTQSAQSQTFQQEIKQFVHTFSNKLSRGSGRRPVTLVGYGMGARLIFHCLETLASEGGIAGRGIVENAVMIGAPVGTSRDKWSAARSVVAGRLVNCFSSKDWLLAIMYRSKSYELGVAGLGPVVLYPELAIHATSTVDNTEKTLCEGIEGGNTPFPHWNTVQQQQGSLDVENVDLTHMVHCHSDYPLVLPSIIRQLQL